MELVICVLCVCLRRAEEEYKRLSEALADEGSYNAVAFRYSADYYDPSQPTEEEDGSKGNGEQAHTCTLGFTEPFIILVWGIPSGSGL